MYSHLTQAVALEQIADRLELAAAERRSAELLRTAETDRSGRSRRSARAAQPTSRPVNVRWSGEVATPRESGCAGA